MRKHDWTNKFLMISYGHQEGMEELKCINQLSDLAEQVDAPGFRYELYKYPEDFGFSTPICIEKGLKSLFKNYPSP